METGAAHVDEPLALPSTPPATSAVMGARNWALVTPDMLVGALARAGRRHRRRGRDGSAVRSVARCLQERYPLCPNLPELLQEIRLKLQCCVQVGILRREGDWFAPVSAGARPSRAQLASFWQLYLAASGQEGAATPRARVSRQPRVQSPPLPPQQPPQHPPPHRNQPHHHHYYYHQVYHIHIHHAALPGSAASATAESWPTYVPPPPPSVQVLTFAVPDEDVSDFSEDVDDEQRLASLDLAEPRRTPRASHAPPATEEPGAEPEPPPPRLLSLPAGRHDLHARLDSDGSEEWDDVTPAPAPVRQTDTWISYSSSALFDTAWDTDIPPRPRSPTPSSWSTPAVPVPEPDRTHSLQKHLRSASAPPQNHPGDTVSILRSQKPRPLVCRRRGYR